MEFHLRFAVVEQRIAAACRNRQRVDIHTYHVSRTQFGSGNGQYARTTAIIQDIFARLQI